MVFVLMAPTARLPGRVVQGFRAPPGVVAILLVQVKKMWGQKVGREKMLFVDLSSGPYGKSRGNVKSSAQTSPASGVVVVVVVKSADHPA